MNRVSCRFLRVSCALLVLLASSAAEIPTPILHLDLPGSWKETPQWVANVGLDEVQAFYDGSTGSLVYIGRSGPMSPANADELAQGFPQVSRGLLGTGMPETDLQRKLGKVFFLLPDDYMKSSGIMDVAGGKGSRIKRIWEIKGSKGNVQSFYVSQLTPGMTVTVSNGTATIQMESAPNKVTRAERRKFNAGEVLIGELETEKLVSKNIVEWFGLPPTFTDQRVRYTYVCYAPHGFDTTTGTFVIVMGAPVNSGLDAEAVLKGLGLPKDGAGVFASLSAIPGLAQAADKYQPKALKLIEQKKYPEALGELVSEVGAEPENPRVYATLSVLYIEIKECSLAWKYYEVAKDLRQEDSDLLQSLRKVCEEPQEKEYKEKPELLKGKLLDNGQVDEKSPGTLLWIAFPPEQSDWPSHAKLPLIRPNENGNYWELTLAQIRKVRELTGVTVPWIIIGPRQKFHVQVIMNRSDNWIMLLIELPAPVTQP